MRRSPLHRLRHALRLHTVTAIVLGPLIVLLIGGVATAAEIWSQSASDRNAADLQLDRLSERIETGVAERFRAYEDALVAGAGLFAASEAVNSEEWRRFISAIDVTGRYPGVNSIGVVYPVPAASADAFVAEARATFDPDFTIKRLSGAPQWDDLFVVTYIEPYAGNEAARGLDVGSEAQRRLALETARDTGKTMMTGRITLVQDRESRPGFLVYVPFYRHGAPIETVSQRRAAIEGFVSAAFVSELFLRGILDPFSDEVSVQVVDKDEGRADTIVFGPGPGEAEDGPDRVISMELAQGEFELRVRRRPGFASGSDTALWSVGAAGGLATLAIAGIVLVVTLSARGSWLRAVAAERNAQHRGDLVDLASHELRNPLAVLSLSAEMLEAEASLIGAPELQQTAAAARAAAGRAEALIAELLDLSRMDAQRLHMEIGPVRLEPAIDDAIALTSSHWGDRPVNRTGPALGEGLVIADPGRLGIVLRNMVDNAFKYSPEGTPVSIDVETDQDEEVAVTVGDQGTGVPPADRAAVFDRFKRGEATAHVGGLGIGLHLSRELARRMGGELTLLPGVPGRGARFRLVLRVPAGLDVVGV